MGKQRLVINLRYLNGFLWKEKFKYEDIRIAMLLKSGYCHVDIFESHRQFLETRGHKTILHVHSPAFWVGHSLLCFHYKLLRPLVKYWQSQGLRAVLYLDDGNIAVPGMKLMLRLASK